MISVRARSRMDHKPRRLVYDNQRVIFVNNFDRNVFGREVCGWRSDQLDFDFIAFAEFVSGFRDLVVYEDIFVLNQLLQTRTTPSFDL